MRISLIGMSNVGKTYWAKKLKEKGFLRFSCDDFIGKKLQKELTAKGYSGVHDVARWMGQPYESQYKQTAAKYLSFEIETMNTILHMLKSKWTKEENIVIDTTGSVIYTSKRIMMELKKSTTIVIYILLTV